MTDIEKQKPKLVVLLSAHPALAITALYLMFSLLGVIYYYRLFYTFHIPILEYANVEDFFLYSLRDPIVIGQAVVFGVGISLIYWLVPKLRKLLAKRFESLGNRLDTDIPKEEEKILKIEHSIKEFRSQLAKPGVFDDLRSKTEISIKREEFQRQLAKRRLAYLHNVKSFISKGEISMREKWDIYVRPIVYIVIFSALIFGVFFVSERYLSHAEELENDYKHLLKTQTDSNQTASTLNNDPYCVITRWSSYVHRNLLLIGSTGEYLFFLDGDKKNNSGPREEIPSGNGKTDSVPRENRYPTKIIPASNISYMVTNTGLEDCKLDTSVIAGQIDDAVAGLKATQKKLAKEGRKFGEVLSNIGTTVSSLTEVTGTLGDKTSDVDEIARALQNTEVILGAQASNIHSATKEVQDAVENLGKAMDHSYFPRFVRSLLRPERTLKEEENGRFFFEPPFSFSSGEFELDEPNEDKLMDFIRDIGRIREKLTEKNFDWAIRVLAHADNEPVNQEHECYSDNRELSLRRGESVVRFLQQNAHIDRGRMAIAAFGDDNPYDSYVPGRDGPNRRVSLELIQR